MKDRKTISILLLSIFIIPSITFAAWWNPLDWYSYFFSKKESAVTTEQVVNQTEVVATTSVSTELVAQPKEEKNFIQKHVAPTIPAPVIKETAPVANAALTAQSTINVKQSLLDLLTQHYKFSERVKGNIIINGGSEYPDPITTAWMKYALELQKNLETDSLSLSKLSNSNSTTGADVSLYRSKLDSQIAVFDQEVKNYNRNYIEYATINFISEHKYDLDISSYHILAADLLSKYDKTFGTSYSPEFRKTLTAEAAIEFANSFLVDVGAR
ncbi:MAG: hypothetical protein WC761_03995 [Candidatus Paceibacterota bacterium]|jgi:hypothetical protein